MKKTGNRETVLILLGIFIVGFFVFFTNNFYKSVWKKSGLEEAEESRVYESQYEMIVGSGKNEFWLFMKVQKKQQKTTMHIWNFMQVIWEPDIMRLIIWRSVLLQAWMGSFWNLMEKRL